MALSETFPAVRATSSLIPITARELVEWTYAVQLANRGGEVTMGHGSGMSQTGLVIERLLLGCTVDSSRGGSGMWGAVHCDEDALTVHGIVEGMPSRMRSLLIYQGETRSTPDWNPIIIPLRCVSVPGSKGRPKGIYSKSNNLIGAVVTYEGDWPDCYSSEEGRAHWPQGDRHLRCAECVIRNARAVYHDWIEALTSLCDRLELAGTRGLRRYRVHGLGAEYEPWRAR
jgi:hypothetical protein